MLPARLRTVDFPGVYCTYTLRDYRQQLPLRASTCHLDKIGCVPLVWRGHDFSHRGRLDSFPNKDEHDLTGYRHASARAEEATDCWAQDNLPPCGPSRWVEGSAGVLDLLSSLEGSRVSLGMCCCLREPFHPSISLLRFTLLRLSRRHTSCSECLGKDGTHQVDGGPCPHSPQRNMDDILEGYSSKHLHPLYD